MYSIQHYVIKVFSDMQKVYDFLLVLWFPPSNKTDHHDIAEILLKVVLNTITLTLEYMDYIHVSQWCICIHFLDCIFCILFNFY